MRAKLLVVAALLASLFASAGTGQAGPAAQSQPAAIRLKAASFSPARGEAPAIPAHLTSAGYAEGQRGYYLVQFAGPVEQVWRDGLAASGAELIDYVPEFAFKVRMTPAQARQASRLAGVAWVGLFHPAYKLSPELRRDGQQLYSVRVERGADAGLAAAAVARTGAQLLGREGSMLLVAADAAQLDAIAQVLDVAWVQNFTLPEKHNEFGAGQIMGANTANTNGYDGSTQTVAVADTGLGDGSKAGAHPDIPATRVVSIHNWPGTTDSCFRQIVDDGAQDVDSGHGTHVAGSVLSDGDAAGVGKGTAPAARLVFQAVENWVVTSGMCKSFGYPDGYYLTGLPSDLRTFFQQAYDAGARIHSNSWGSDVNGDYTANSAQTDDFIWGHRDMTITFSAGNSGEDANNDGIVDSDSTGSPATAKNVITVGASENDRNGSYPCDTNLSYSSHDVYQQKADGSGGYTCAEMGGNNLLGTGSRWSFNTEPLKSDPTAGNKEQMALFSSRGPTDDGRIKPDIVAPGTWILSGYSSRYQEHYGSQLNPQNGIYQWDGWGMPLNSAYKWMGGTSMSNPLAAGGAAVVRDYYQKARSLSASAALVKATLINTAVDMLDENNDGASDNDYPIPNVHEGWGRVDLANATDGSHKFVDQTAGIGTGASATYSFSVNTSKPVKISLVWSDYPSTESASKNLVNDLDLEVTGPNGTYRGNVFSGGWSQTGGSADRTNNVENVYVAAAGAGTWTVTVRGFNVPNGPQPFALVVDGADSDLTAGGGGGGGGGGTTIHVGDLDGSNRLYSNGWTATVTVTVHNASDAAVSGAAVSGTWSYSSSAVSCTTDSTGKCSITTGRLSKNSPSVSFTVQNVSASGASYSATANHDPDGDSNGTSITINRP